MTADARQGDRAARRPADSAGRQPALQRLGAGRAASAGDGPVAARRRGDGPGRSRRPDVRAAGKPDVRGAVGEAGLVRHRAPGRIGRARRVLAGAAGRLRPGGDRAGSGQTRRHGSAELPGRAETFAVIDAAFSQRRKTLRSALAAWAGSPAAAEEALRAAGVDPSLRGEALGIADFARIAAAAGHCADGPALTAGAVADAAACRIRSADRDLSNQASSCGRDCPGAGEGQPSARRGTGAAPMAITRWSLSSTRCHCSTR